MNIKQANKISSEELRSVIGEKYFKETEGGSTIDHVCAYLKSVGEDHTSIDALRWLTNMAAARVTVKQLGARDTASKTKGSTWRIVRSEAIEDLALIRYLEKSGIPLNIARRHLQELYIKNKADSKTAYALGLKNEDGGYELRSPYVRSFVAPATIAFIRSKKVRPKSIHIFNGLMDMLSALTRFPALLDEADVICLTALSCLDKVFPYITGYSYQTLYSWMNNDDQGIKAELSLSEFVKTQERLRHKPMNAKYQTFKDVNAWHIASLKP